MRAIRARFFGFVVVAVTCFIGNAAYAQTHSEIVLGEEVANRVCAGCHGVDGIEGSVVQGVKVRTLAQIARGPNMTLERLEALLLIPHRPMSGFSLQTREIRELAAYMMSLK